MDAVKGDRLPESIIGTNAICIQSQNDANGIVECMNYVLIVI